MDERIHHHTQNAADLKEAIGGDRALRKVQKTVRDAAERLEALGPSFKSILAAINEDLQVRETVGSFGAELGKVYDELHAMAESFKTKTDANGFDQDPAASGNSDCVDDDDNDEDDDFEENDDDAELIEDEVVPPAAPTADAPSGQNGSAAAEAGAAAQPPSQPRPEAPAGEAKPPAGAAASSGARKPTFLQGLHETAAAKERTARACSGFRRKKGAKSSLTIRTADKSKHGSQQAAAGGATAPTPVPMQDTSEAAQQGGLIVEENGGN